MWHRSRLFTRPFSHAPVFLSFVLSHGVFPYSQIRSQWVPRVFFLLYPFGFSDAYFVFVRYTKSSVKVPFLIFHAFTRAFTHEFPFPYAFTMRFLMRLFVRTSTISCVLKRVPVCSVVSHPRVPDRYSVVSLVRLLSFRYVFPDVCG